LKDVLEESVDEKYYLSDKMIDYISQNGTKNFSNANCKINCTIARPLTTDQNKRAGTTNYLCEDLPDNFDLGERNNVDPIRLGGLYDTETSKHQAGAIWDKEAISPTLDTMQGGNRQPFITVDENSIKVRVANKKGYDEAYEGDSINLEQPNSKTRRGRVGKQVAQTLNTMPQQAVVEPMAYDEQNKYIRQDGCVGTLTTDGSSPKQNNRVLVWDGYNQRIRADQSCVGTLTQNCGADLKRNGQGIIEQRVGSVERTEELLNDIADGKYPPDTAFGKYLFQSSRFNDKPLEECSQTIKSTKVDCGVIHNLRIRKLTPKECFRLMGFDDADFHKAESVNSNTQLYKQAGNSIVVDVLYYLLKSLYENL
jgi:DNA (cytosine-5)-methyltransferase 1